MINVEYIFLILFLIVNYYCAHNSLLWACLALFECWLTWLSRKLASCLILGGWIERLEWDNFFLANQHILHYTYLTCLRVVNIFSWIQTSPMFLYHWEKIYVGVAAKWRLYIRKITANLTLFINLFILFTAQFFFHIPMVSFLCRSFFTASIYWPGPCFNFVPLFGNMSYTAS
jgi:hypothetical protein